MRSIGHCSVVALVAAGLVFGAGCGGSSGKAQEASDTAPSGSPVDDGSDSADASDASDTPASSEIPEIADGNWQGRAQVKVSGDFSSDFASDGTGSTLDGFTNLAFSQGTGGTVSLAIGGDLDPALSISVDKFGTTASLTKDCTISFTKNDATNLAAEFTCPKVQGLDTSTKVRTISVKGNFTMTGGS